MWYVSGVGCVAGGFIVMIGVATQPVPRSLLVNPPMHLSNPLKQVLDGAQ
jgi:hypothetical protein